MSLAYLISAHTDAPQLARLIRALHTDAEFFVHVDKKSDIRPFKEAITTKNVHFIENRTDIRWATITQVDYQMSLIEAAVNHPRRFDRLITLSGLDYPLWSNEHITKWIEEQGDRELLQGINLNTPHINRQQQELYSQSRPFFRLLGNRWDNKLSIAARKVLTTLGYRKRLFFKVNEVQWDIYKGGSWWCISEELASHILRTYQNQPAIRKHFKDSFGPDELVPQTIAFNSPHFASRCLLTEGAYPGLDALTPLHYIVYDPIIKVMTEDDLPALLQSGKMFARKFRSGVSDKVVAQIDKVRNTCPQ